MIKMLISIGVLLSINLHAGFLKKGLTAYEQGDKKLASEFYSKGCKDKNIYACIELGKLYATGEGVKLNSRKAKKLFKKSCNNGYTNGCFELGILYYQGGEGVKQNKRQAKLAFGTACTYGHEQACDIYKKLNHKY